MFGLIYIDMNISPSDFWVDDLSHEEDVLCGALSDEDHEWTIKLQNRDMAERHKCDANSCSSCSSGSFLIYI